MSILHRFQDINIYLLQIKKSRNLDHAYLGGQFVITRLTIIGPTSVRNLTILSLAIPKKSKGV